MYTFFIVIIFILAVGAVSFLALNWWSEYNSSKPSWILIFIIVIVIIIINSVLLGEF